MSRVSVSGPSLEAIAAQAVEAIQSQLPSRAYRAANEMRNSALSVLSGPRSGRSYGSHTASAPGEPPAVRSGAFRISWRPTSYAFGASYISRIETGIGYAGWLENGTPGGQMAPRPHHERIQEHALPAVTRIYDEPYFQG